MTTAVLNQSTSIPEAMVTDAPAFLGGFGGQCASHQGDLVIVALDSLPKSAKPRANRQLADGNTQGSRHVLERGDVYDCDVAEVASEIKRIYGEDIGQQYIGPVFVSTENPTDSDLTHPEHGNQGFPAGQVCAVVFQRNLDAEQRERRSRD